MTLYLLFEQLEAGRVKLNMHLQVSPSAALQPPTKLGLKTNQASALVQDAIKGLVTCSANDAAVVVGEAIAGSEAQLRRSHDEKGTSSGYDEYDLHQCLGTARDMEQIMTARYQALLGLAIQERFPE